MTVGVRDNQTHEPIAAAIPRYAQQLGDLEVGIAIEDANHGGPLRDSFEIAHELGDGIVYFLPDLLEVQRHLFIGAFL
jgi:hypothetical protein